MAIIKSLLDTDLYKLTMQMAVLHQFPGALVEYKFKCRTPGVDLCKHKDEIRNEIKEWCNLWLSKDELSYLSTIRFLKSDYIEYLRNFKSNFDYIHVEEINGQLDITIRGPWVSCIYAEVPILAIVNEVYFKHIYNIYFNMSEAESRLANKIKLIKEKADVGFKFMDFGTRRRFSYAWHKQIVEILKKELPNNFIGTSNVKLAMDYGLVPRGTMAHEYIMGMQSMVRISESQKYAFETWANEYRGDLGIALSDTLGFDAFLNDFDLYFSKLFDGARHDSGDPFKWCDKLIKHYEKFNIDPRTKIAVFSDGLDFNKAIALYNAYKDRIKTSFGIGTNLTNDTGLDAIQIVIKMTKCNEHPLTKISDSPGKQMCEDAEYIKYVKSVFGIKDR